MSARETPLSQVIGLAQTAAIQEALRIRLRAVGVRRVEEGIGKPDRFFENSRQRGKIKVQDFLATCAEPELDPADFIREALGDQVSPEIRPPRIVETTWKRIRQSGPGLGQARLAELEASLQSNPRQTRGILSRIVGEARREELPRILGLYGSSLRVESDLDRSKVVLSSARDLARELSLPLAEADILIRRAYVSLERDRLPEAMRKAEESTVISARFDDREGEGRGFMAMGMFRFYSQDFQASLDDLAAVLRRSSIPSRIVAAHQCSALCYIALDQKDDARQEIETARRVSPEVEVWMQGKLAWTEARLFVGDERLRLLMSARDALSKRPADLALVMVEIVEHALGVGRTDIANREASKLCTLLERTGNPRVEKAILYLTRHQARLTQEMASRIRQAVDEAQARRFSRLIRSDE
jgi:tetratricopeptide (TPR) repeat protein